MKDTFEVFLSHAPADAETARLIENRLGRAGGVQVVREEVSNVAESWEGGLSSGAIILVLSPDSVPARGGREAWAALLDHAESGSPPPVGCVLLRECVLPPLLERKTWFLRWHDDGITAARALEAWIVGLLRTGNTPQFFAAESHAPAEAESLLRDLVDGEGFRILHGQNSASRALAFAAAAERNFQRVIWTPAGGRAELSVAADIAAQLGVVSEQDSEAQWRRIAAALEDSRVLLILDGRAQVPASLRKIRRSSVLAIDDPPLADVTPPEDEETLRFWRAASVCVHGKAPVRLASLIAGIQPHRAIECRDRLHRHGLAEPIDREGAFMRLRAISEKAEVRQRHAAILHHTYSHWQSDAGLCEEWLAELMPAVQRALDYSWEFAKPLAWQASVYLQAIGRYPEAVQVLEQLREITGTEPDLQEKCETELGWLLNRVHRPRVAAAPQQLSLY